ncbi:hypothetical protein DQ04_15771000 [Trypanosoma grayi]|uniref:hypothetical protein n=1 Tax=Trypanosoma grayi TaxID=71804 RepID=UPI0004F4A9EA|nr:hypothetical protein DQ04_15771000 [Trypanosoma grayi]KEG06130.1 hypothetical protein DQ04_15771000 [Trypanosoma grayi]
MEEEAIRGALVAVWHNVECVEKRMGVDPWGRLLSAASPFNLHRKARRRLVFVRGLGAVEPPAKHTTAAHKPHEIGILLLLLLLSLFH